MIKKSIQKSTWVVLPAFNEERIIRKIIYSIQKKGFTQIIVVDDGSLDNTYSIAKEMNCIALRHVINRGKGAATQTGLDAAKILKADIIVTMDADGQHLAKDIENLVRPIWKGTCDVVLGNRLLTKEGMPLTRRIINLIGNIITYLFYGIYVNDSQSGFRAYSAKANRVISTTMDRYEFESEILQQIKSAKLKFIEVPINVRYTKYSKTRYNDLPSFPRQRFTNGINMLYKMIIRSILS